MLISVFLHAEFISAMKKFKFGRFSGKMQKNRKMNKIGNFSQFFEIFTETLEQNIRKSQ